MKKELQKITKEDVAKMLDGRQYMDEITPDIQYALQNSDLVIVFGASDDLMEFRGAVNDEIDCYDGGTAYITGKGLPQNKCDDGDCPYFQKLITKAIHIEAAFDRDGFSWVYDTEIPHATFIIMNNLDKYCRGIAFNLSDVKNMENNND